MTVRNDHWSVFKNYMHNELQISKEDIKQWLYEAVKAEARQTIYNSRNMDRILKEVFVQRKSGVTKFTEPMNQLVKEAVTDMLKDRIVIGIK